jgi:hypothetical protein
MLPEEIIMQIRGCRANNVAPGITWGPCWLTPWVSFSMIGAHDSVCSCFKDGYSLVGCFSNPVFYFLWVIMMIGKKIAENSRPRLALLDDQFKPPFSMVHGYWAFRMWCPGQILLLGCHDWGIKVYMRSPRKLKVVQLIHTIPTGMILEIYGSATMK